MFRKLIAISLLILTVTPLSAEYLFLKDGSIIEGTVISETAAGVRFKEGETDRINLYPPSQVMRVLYTEINMGRIYVQLKNGENMRVYMVDEDRESYTFRRELNKPEEFKLERSEVLFVAERNPSGLKGKVSYNDVQLEWYPPFDPMASYNIFLREDKQKDFSPAGVSDRNLFHLKGLNSNSKYFVFVTGVDESKTETKSSNIFEVNTLNHPPVRPSGLNVGISGEGDIFAAWEASSDPDGTVVKYEVSAVKDGAETPLGDVKETVFIIKKEKNEIDRVKVRAVDDRDERSDAADARAFMEYFAGAVFSPGLLFPFMKFGELGGTAPGGMLSFSLENLFIKGLSAGAEGGYYYIPGIDSTKEKGQDVHRFHFAPFGLRVGYDYFVIPNLRLAPYISLGAAYIDLSYTSRDETNGVDSEKSASGFDATASINLSAEWMFTEYFFAGINCGYGLLFESDGAMYFARAGISAGARW